MILIRRELNSNLVDHISFSPYCQLVSCSIPFGSSNLILVCVYRSQKCSREVFNKCLDHIAILKNTYPSVLVVGDFNCLQIDWVTKTFNRSAPKHSKLLFEFAQSSSLEQHILEPTFKTNILDLVFSFCCSVTNCSVMDSLTNSQKEHKIVHFSISPLP